MCICWTAHNFLSPSHMHTSSHTHTRACMHAQTHTHTHTGWESYKRQFSLPTTYTDKLTHTHTCMYACMHTHTHTHTLAERVIRDRQTRVIPTNLHKMEWDGKHWARECSSHCGHRWSQRYEQSSTPTAWSHGCRTAKFQWRNQTPGLQQSNKKTLTAQVSPRRRLCCHESPYVLPPSL